MVELSIYNKVTTWKYLTNHTKTIIKIKHENNLENPSFLD